MVLAGHVRNGAIVLDDPVALPEGAAVSVLVAQPQPATGSGTPSVSQITKNGLPVMIVHGNVPPIDPARIRESLEEEGF
jgi:hypothetical protein